MSSKAAALAGDKKQEQAAVSESWRLIPTYLGEHETESPALLWWIMVV